MAPTVLTEWPSEFDAGTTVKLQRAFTDFPPGDGWNLTAILAGASVLTVPAVVSGSNFMITLTDVQTATLTAGTYVVQEKVSNGSESYIAAQTTVIVNKNISTAADGDFQTQDEKDLIVVKAAINGRLTADQQSYQIGNRMVTKIPIKELYQIEQMLTSRINATKNPGTFGQTVQVQFDGSTGP